jgi:hypothetical protein
MRAALQDGHAARLPAKRSSIFNLALQCGHETTMNLPC